MDRTMTGMASIHVRNVLFCCTGNVFRSMTEEYALRRELQRLGRA